MYIKGDLDSNQKIIGNGLVLNVDAAQYRSFPRGGDIVTSGLVLNLDAGNPSSYPGTGTTWYDISGNQNNGTLTNGPTYNSANQGSIVFDGTNDYVNCGNNTSLNITETFTISLWIYATSNTAQAYILDKDFDKYAIIIGYQSGFVNFFNGAYQPNATTTQISISPNTWTNIVYSKNLNSLSNNWSGYKNGVNVFTTTANFTLTTNTGQLNLGATRPGIANAYFNGRIANAQIYNRALSAAEVTQNYDALKYRYGVIGSTWFDLSGNANNGTLINGPTLDFNNGGSIVFDGTNDYVDIPNNTSLNSNIVSVSIWFKYSTIGGGNPGNLISKIDSFGSYNGWSLFIETNNVLKAEIKSASAATVIVGPTISTNTWYNAVMVLTSGGTSYIYLNGTSVASASIITYTVTASQPLRIARAVDSYWSIIGGNVSNLQIYNRALSATEVLNNFNAVKSRFGFPNTSIVTHGLVLNLNAGNTNSYPTTGTTWYDLTGIYNGTLINGPTFNSANGGSIVFDGTNDYVSTTSGIINITSNWSVIVWFKTTGSTNIPSMVVRGNVDETLIWACYLQNSTGKVQFLMRNGTDQVVTGTTSTNNTGWHMATYTKDSSNVVRVYLDGVQENSATITNLSNIGLNVALGRWGDSTGPYYYNGNIAMVLFYNTNLSDSQIKQNFDATKSTFGL